MRKRLLRMGVVVAVVGALLAGGAGAATVRVGTLVLQADGGFKPQLLPKRSFAPIRFQGYADIKTTNGSLPPALQHVELEFDRDGRLSTAGLPVCEPTKLEGATPQQARSRCRDAIVGRGQVEAAASLAGLLRVELRSPLTVFNGPRQNGSPTVIGHARAPFPVSETYVVVAPIERRSGAFGYRTAFDVPPIAGGLGSLTHIDTKISRLYRFRGAERSYVSARCLDSLLKTQGYFSFADGTIIYGSVFKICRAKP